MKYNKKAHTQKEGARFGGLWKLASRKWYAKGNHFMVIIKRKKYSENGVAFELRRF